jgi:hypothetical protein
MQALTLEQLNAAAKTGGIASVTLKAKGGAFLVVFATQSGENGLLVTTRGRQPRRFSDLRKAMLLLRDMGIATALVDAARWRPEETAARTRRPDRAIAMRRAHAAAAHDRWFRAEVEAGLREAADPASVMLSHEQVMADMKTAMARAKGRTSRRRAR